MKRTNEAFAAEVYRRSEATIQAHKKRRRVWLTTLPVTVCVLAVSVAVLPRLLPDKTTNTTGLSDLYDGSSIGFQGGIGAVPEDVHDGLTDDTVSFSTFALSVEVQGADGRSRRSVDEEAILALEQQLPYLAVDMALRGSCSAGSAKNNAATNDKGTQSPYRLVLTGESGTRYGYRLLGNALYVENADQWLTLTPEEASDLEEALQQFLDEK